MLPTTFYGNQKQPLNVFDSHTVDGSEIQGSPVDIGSLSHYLQGFGSIPGGAGFLPSTVGSMGFTVKIHFVKLTASLPLQIGQNLKKERSLPTIIFRSYFSFREGTG